VTSVSLGTPSSTLNLITSGIGRRLARANCQETGTMLLHNADIASVDRSAFRAWRRAILDIPGLSCHNRLSLRLAREQEVGSI
jgi:hypothetical protein